jgi:hypothetical protein
VQIGHARSPHGLNYGLGHPRSRPMDLSAPAIRHGSELTLKKRQSPTDGVKIGIRRHIELIPFTKAHFSVQIVGNHLMVGQQSLGVQSRYGALLRVPNTFLPASHNQSRRLFGLTLV